MISTALVGGKFLFLKRTWETNFFVIFWKAIAIGVSSWRAAGLPASEASRILYSIGNAPKKGTFLSFAKYSAPFLPKI